MSRAAALAVWPLYFPGEAFDPKDRRAELIEALVGFFATADGASLARLSPNEACGYACALDFALLQQRCGVADVFIALQVAPAEALGCLAASLHAVNLCASQSPPGLPPPLAASRVRVHLFNYAASKAPFRAVRSNAVGQLVTVRGTVVRVSAVRSLVTALPYACAACGTRQLVALPDGLLRPPRRCLSDTCRSRRFTEERAFATAQDVQRLKLQELPDLTAPGAAAGAQGDADADQEEEELLARTLDVELVGGLCDAVAPGDVVTVCAMVKALADPSSAPPPGGKGKKKDAQPSVFKLHLEAVSLLRAPRDPSAAGEAASSRLLLCAEPAAPPGGGPAPQSASLSAEPPFSDAELRFVAAFSKATHGQPGGALRLLSASLCPGIHGHALVKAGLVLALLGGTQLDPDEAEQEGLTCSGATVRGEIHVLLVGDPGLGKSQLLAAAAQAAARGCLLSGPGASAVGLTASVGRDAASGAATLEAGACVVAHRGVVGLDELDKLPRAQHAALLEVMEQGTVTVTKAGVAATLPAKCSLFAAGNPVGGRYNQSKTLQGNLNLSAPLLSRFDLVFLLLDSPDAAADEEMTAHVLRARRRGGQADSPLLLQSSPCGSASKATLAERLRVAPSEPLVPLHLLRKYIEYAKRYTRPSLSPAAERVLKEFYLELRAKASVSPGALPVTVRSLEALARLAEARCRCELRDVASAGDAEEVVQLVRGAMPEAQPGGGFDVGDRGRGYGAMAAEPKRFLIALAQEAAQREGGLLSYAEVVAVADRILLSVPDVEALVERMNESGDLLRRGRLYSVFGVKGREGTTQTQKVAPGG